MRGLDDAPAIGENDVPSDDPFQQVAAEHSASK